MKQPPSNKHAEPKPGEQLARVMQTMRQEDHLPFLELIEQKFRREGAMDLLKEVLAYKAAQLPPPTSTPSLSNVISLRPKIPEAE